MELFSPAWFAALGAIIVIDLILAGDNAILIALAAKNLPPHLQKKAIMWGTVGAIIIRTAMTLIAVQLLKIPGLMAVGGIALVWIAYKLLVDDGEDKHHDAPAANTFWGAMKTIVIADALMGIDNVVAVAGAAKGDMVLVVLGLLISVPIILYGSTLFLKYIGAGVLAFTAAKMIVNEPLLKAYFAPPVVYWGFVIAVIVGTLGIAHLVAKRNSKAEPSAA
jgi:YjbE family integral membrane protein